MCVQTQAGKSARLIFFQKQNLASAIYLFGLGTQLVLLGVNISLSHVHIHLLHHLIISAFSWPVSELSLVQSEIAFWQHQSLSPMEAQRKFFPILEDGCQDGLRVTLL